MALECEKCGACCRQMIIEIEWLDILREPRLALHAKLMDGNGAVKFESDWEKEFLLACGERKPCAFHKDNQCGIYPTRPNVCVAFEPGGEQCTMSRAAEGLKPLGQELCESVSRN